jgi:ABC-type sugar transport system, periplasmic component
MKKERLLLACMFCIAGILVVSTASSGEAKKDYSFAFSGADLANPWVAALKDGFEAGCRELGVNYVSMNASSAVDKQISDIENAIQSGANAVITNPLDGNALETIFTEARAAGVASITCAQGAGAATAQFLVDDHAYGTIIAKNAVLWIKDNLKGKGKCLILAEDNIQSSIRRGDGIEETLRKECPELEIVARQTANTPALGLTVTESILLAHPDLNVIVCCNDSGGIGAYQAMQNEGIGGSDRGIFSGDATAEVIKYMKEDDSVYRGTADLQPYQCGYDAVMKAYEYLTNGFPAQQEIYYLKMEPVTKAQAKTR